MSETAKFLDAVKARHGLASDYALAKVLEISRQEISNYRTGRHALGVKVCFKIAALLDCDAASVIAAVESERARTDQDRDFWKGALLRAAAAVVAAVGVGAAAMPSSAQAQSNASPPVYYGKSRRRLEALISLVSGIPNAAHIA